MNSILPIIKESERVIAAAVKHFNLKTKPEDICITVQSAGRKNALGWFWGESWKNKKNTYHEINLCAEHLTSHNMGETLIHELAHAENKTLGIKDYNNRIHNKKFKAMAESLGLEVKPRDKSVGYGHTDLAEPAKKFLAAIKFDRDIFAAYRCGAKKIKQTTRLVKCECADCGYVARVTRKWIDESGAVLCPCNSKPMAYDVPAEGKED